MSVLSGKTALVTGAASGIGRAASLLFASEGASVIALDLSAAVEATLEELRAAGGAGDAVIGDASDGEVIERAVSLACSRFGRIDIMFANAGISGGLVGLFDLTAAQWTHVMQVNTIGVFLAIQAAAKRMAPQGSGSIICTASVAGLRSGAGDMPYSASKAAVISLVQTAANQLAGTGVRVNAVCPGLTETGMTKPMFDMARQRGSAAKLGQLNPLRRPGEAHEAAQVALFLASEAASYVNGQAIAVDGGLSSSHPTVPGRLV